MKKVITISAFMLLIFTFANAQTKVSLRFDEKDLKLHSNDTYTIAELKGCKRPEAKSGTPLLPVKYVNVLIPSGASITKITSSSTENLVANDVMLYPAQPPVSLNAKNRPAFVKPDAKAYGLMSKFPLKSVKKGSTINQGGYTYISVCVNPLRYIPGKKELYLAEKIDLTVHYKLPKNSKKVNKRHQERFRTIIKKLVINPENETDFSPAVRGESEPAADIIEESSEPAEETSNPVSLGDVPISFAPPQTDYLIITNDALKDSFQALANHRASFNGFNTNIVTTESIYTNYTGNDNQMKIRNCIKDYYDNAGTMYVVLGGCDQVIPMRIVYVDSPIGNKPIPTDHYYAALDGTWNDIDSDNSYGEIINGEDEADLGAEVYLGRIPVNTAGQVNIYVNKVIAYETNPSLDILRKFASKGGTSWDTYTGTDRPTDTMNDTYPQFTDTEHNPTVNDTEMWGRRMYRDHIQAHGWNADTVGYGFSYLSYTPGLDTEGWNFLSRGGHGGAAWTSDEISLLTVPYNFIYSSQCDTAAFDHAEPCESEAYLRNPNGGALVYVGCSREGWGYLDTPPADAWSNGGPSNDFEENWNDAIFQNGAGDVGEAFYDHKVAAQSWVSYQGVYRWIFMGVNLQGDPAIRFYGVKTGVSVDVDVDSLAENEASTATFTFTRVGDTTSSLTVNYTMGGTATITSDYSISNSSSVTISTGQNTATVTLYTVNDAVLEGDETATLTITPNAAYETYVDTATVTLWDDEGPGRVRFSSTSSSVNEDAGPITLTVERITGSTGSISVDYATADGSAAAGSDYTTTSGTLSWADGETASKTIDVPVNIDGNFESPETFTVTLSNETGGVIIESPSTTTVTITNDDYLVSIAATDNTASEGVSDTGTYTITRDGPNNTALTVNYAFQSGSSSAESGDFTLSPAGSVSFAAGESTKTVTLTAIDDTTVEFDETVTVAITGDSSYNIGSPSNATITIGNSDNAPPVIVLDSPTLNVTSVSTGATLVLETTVTDDGEPLPTNLALTWSQISGPGTASFTASNADDTSVSFSTDGFYELRLTADDGMLQTNMDITVAAGWSIPLYEDFESPVVTGYQKTAPDNGNWVRAVQGYKASENGLVNKDGGDFTAADPNMQGYAFRYGNSGVTTAQGVIGALEAGASYKVTFKAVMDGIDTGIPYTCQLIAFAAGAARDDCRSTPADSTVLASDSGNATTDGSFTTITIDFTADAGTYAADIGKDLGIRFKGAADSAIIDDVMVMVQSSSGPTFNVTYNGNGSDGGSVPVDSNNYAENDTVTVLGNSGSLVKSGNTFAGWNTAADGSGSSYSAGNTFTITSGVNLYAQWTSLPTYTVTYNGNGNTGGSVPADQTKVQGIDLNLASNSGSLIKTGHTFSGWNTAADGNGTDYAEGVVYSSDADLALFAKWTVVPTYTVSYEGNGNTGGTAPGDQTKSEGVDLNLAANSGSLVKTGFTFAGWNTNTSGTGTDYAEGAIYTADADLTLYAKWITGPSVVPIVDVFVHNEKENYGGLPADVINGSGMNSYPDTGNPGWPSGEGLPSTWTATSNAFQAEHQAQDLLAADSGDLDPSGSALEAGVGPSNGKIGWFVFDLGASTADLKNLYIWNIRENSGRIAATFNVYVSETPTVAVAHGPTNSTSRDYDFASGGWTEVANGLTGTFKGNQVIDLGGATARYIGIEIMTNGGDGSKVGLAEIGITKENTPPPTYTVTYEGNGNDDGEVPVDSSSYAEGDNFVPLANTGNLTKTGFTFECWNTKADGTGTNYTCGLICTMGASDLVLYAKWIPVSTYVLTVNDGTGGGSYAEGVEVSISATVPAGQHFINWTGDTANIADENSATTTVTMSTSAVTVTANFADGDTCHSADSNSDWSISQSEVESFITAYNSNNNSVNRDAGSITDGRITMREVMRVIYLYNQGGEYIGGQATVDTYDNAAPAVAANVAEKPVVSGTGDDGDGSLVVSSTADSGVGSLRDAIAIASNGETIIIDGSLDTITVLSEIVIDKSITIDGQGAAIVSGDKMTRIFRVENAQRDIDVTLKNIGIVDAENNSDEFGGAIYNNGQTLNLDTVLFDGNANTSAHQDGVLYGKGGAVYSSGTLNVENCVFRNNSASEENDIFEE